MSCCNRDRTATTGASHSTRQCEVTAAHPILFVASLVIMVEEMDDACGQGGATARLETLGRPSPLLKKKTPRAEEQRAGGHRLHVL